MKGYWHIVAIFVTFGIVGNYFNSKMALFVSLTWLLWQYYVNRLGKLPLVISLTLSLFFIWYIPITNKIPQQPLEKQTDFIGKIKSPIRSTEKKLEFEFLDLQANKTYLAVYFPKDHKNMQTNEYQLRYGSICRLSGVLEFPEHARNPGQFDYQKYVSMKGIGGQLMLSSIEGAICQGDSLLARIYSLGTKLQTYLRGKYTESTFAWIKALVFGDDSLLSDDTIELFQRWGLSHILAISGLHIGLIVSLLYFLLMKTGMVTREKAEWILLLFLPIYALLAGGQPSVWRASLTVFLLIIIGKTKQKYSLTDLISIVFLLLLLLDKYIVYQIGFQFSFLVTFGLLLSSKWIAQTKSLFFRMLKISFIAQMMILPFQFTYFSTVHPLSIMLNVVVVPYFSLFVIPFMFLFVLLSPLSSIMSVVDMLFTFVQKYAIFLIEACDHIAYFPWIMGDFPFWAWIGYYGLLLLMMRTLELLQSKHAFAYGVSVTALIIVVALRPYLSSYGTITMLDIGQGDAFVIELPYRKGVIFIDAGATFSFQDGKPNDHNYKQIIKPFLYAKGIRAIDAIFISHRDLDHMGSVDFMVEELRVKKIIVSQWYDLTNDTITHWVENGVEIMQPSSGETVSISGQLFSILSPEKDFQSENENSLVIYANFANVSWLFTGDIGTATENELIRQYQRLPVDVLKIGHHGSNTSTGESFINHIKPMYALISVGRHNMYGHPADEVLELLQKHQINILRTDKSGAVVFQYRTDEWNFYSYLP